MEYRDYIIQIFNAYYGSLAKELIVKEETYNRELFIELHELTDVILDKVTDLHNDFCEDKEYIEEELAWCKNFLKKNHDTYVEYIISTEKSSSKKLRGFKNLELEEETKEVVNKEEENVTLKFFYIRHLIMTYEQNLKYYSWEFDKDDK